MRMMQSQFLRRRGAWTALFALALQIVLAFGHVHPLVASSGAVAATAAGGVLQSGTGDPVKKSRDAAQDICAICVTIHLANTVVLPPSVPLAVPARGPDLVGSIGSTFVLPRLPPHPFQTRGPPAA